jgi:hypothetical protein
MSADSASEDLTDEPPTGSMAASGPEIERLREENRQLRDQNERFQRSSHARTSLGFAAVGLFAGAGGVLFPRSQEVLFALGGTGLFGAVLTYYLMPERFISASLSERIHLAYAAAGHGLVDDLGLQGSRIYVPVPSSTDPRFANVRLFVPQHAEYELPEPDAINSTLVVTEGEQRRGLALAPTGAALYAEFETTTREPPSDTGERVDQLLEMLVDGFELVDSATRDLDTERGRLTVGVVGSAYGPVTRFDHPVGSFVATVLARYLDVPVRAETTESDHDRTDYLGTCTWDA